VSTHTRKVDVRLVAATNRNLEKMAADREFRSDLFYRLNVFPIRIPSLRERNEEIPLLVSYFAQKFAKLMRKEIESVPSAVMKGLTAWERPGNIRELENFIERAVILTRGKALEVPLTELRKTETEMAVDAVVNKKRASRISFTSGPEIKAGAAGPVHASAVGTGRLHGSFQMSSKPSPSLFCTAVRKEAARGKSHRHLRRARAGQAVRMALQSDWVSAELHSYTE
jgi:Transcriptional regulator containing GAF, AAA-type ATPase, and DNA binding domains